jgi:hypothetical protein
VAESAWRLTEVAARWDELELRSWVLQGNDRVLYQRGHAAELLAPWTLLQELAARGAAAAAEADNSGLVLLTGTVPAIGGVRPADLFEAELFEPQHGRCIRLRYAVRGVANPNPM